MRGKKVVIGMSGGVDSSVAASILKEEGYDLYGITLQLWKENGDEDKKWQERSCCKVNIARYVSERLEIPYEVIDVQDAFRNQVVDEFYREYMRGRTPNPCIRCNEWIKFGILLEIARERGADFLATGHYVCTEYDRENDCYYLKRGADRRKDQSYFLYRLTRDKLPFLLFPLGRLNKSEVWKRSEMLGLPPDEVKESQEICFVTQNDYRRFITEYASTDTIRPGNMVTPDGRVVGEHKGIPFYTIGQRRSLGISMGERLYVIKIDAEKNEVVVGREEDLYRSQVMVSDISFINNNDLSDSNKVSARIRYRCSNADAIINRIEDKRIDVNFVSPQKAVTPGQSIVFYKGEYLLGGGIIE
ncbi:MAG: tRNA 2-thiouridine(34) synthase MnmA [Nitrospirota bacterium]